MQQAYAQRCPVLADAYACVENGQRAQHTQQQQQTQQGWSQLFNTMTDIVRMQQQVNDQRHDQNTQNLQQNRLDNIFGPAAPAAVQDPLNNHGYQPPGSLNPPGGGAGGGGGSGVGGGRSGEDCLRQYCPMCFNDVDLLGVSIDPQCNECRSLNTANIRACQEGGSPGSPVRTTTTYRIVCLLSEPTAGGSRYCVGYGCIDPGVVIRPNWRLVESTRSWDYCHEHADTLNSER